VLTELRSSSVDQDPSDLPHQRVLEFDSVSRPFATSSSHACYVRELYYVLGYEL
jgi:hypothetical protein